LAMAHSDRFDFIDTKRIKLTVFDKLNL
jgi:hypothetical protein